MISIASKALDGLRNYSNHQIIIYQYLGGGIDEELYRGQINDEAKSVIEQTFARDKEWTDRVRLEKAIKESGKTIDEIIHLLKQAGTPESNLEQRSRESRRTC